MDAEDELVRIFFDQADVLRPGDPLTAAAAEAATQIRRPHPPFPGIEDRTLHDYLDR